MKRRVMRPKATVASTLKLALRHGQRYIYIYKDFLQMSRPSCVTETFSSEVAPRGHFLHQVLTDGREGVRGRSEM